MKKFTVGLLTGVMLTASVTAVASSGRTIQVFDNVKRVVVDKVEKPFDESNAPFVYNGTTYVPLRFIADALGEPIDWDGQTGTVFIGETNNKNAHYWDKDINVSVYDAHRVDYDYSYGKPNNSVKSNTGNHYNNYFTFDGLSSEGRFCEVTLPLNGNYSSFEALLGYTNEYIDKTNIRFTIFIDGREVYNEKMSTGMLEKPIKIDTKNALNITFKVEGLDQDSEYYEMALFNGEFIN